MSEYFKEPISSGGRVKVELGLSNYATKVDLKNASGLDTSKFSRKVDLANSKSDLDKLYIDKLLSVPVDLSKLSYVVKNNVVKNLYIMLRSKLLKIKYLISILLTQLLILLLILK